MKTLKQIIHNKAIYLRLEGGYTSTEMWRERDILQIIEEWLKQKRQEINIPNYAPHATKIIDELLEELGK